jgi:hypothetical protein
VMADVSLDIYSLRALLRRQLFYLKKRVCCKGI